MFNLVLLIGKMTDKPTLRTLENGQIVGNFALAVQRPFKNMEGKISSYDVEKKKVELLLDLFGQETSVEVELSQIENLK